MAVAGALADRGHRVRCATKSIGVGKALSKLNFILIPVSSQNCLNLSIPKKKEKEKKDRSNTLFKMKTLYNKISYVL